MSDGPSFNPDLLGSATVTILCSPIREVRVARPRVRRDRLGAHRSPALAGGPFASVRQTCSGRVTGNSLVGGLVGWNRGGVAASYGTGRVEGGLAIGGLAGTNSGTVAASYATARVDGSSGVGGLVGFLTGGTVNASYATGPVSGPGNVGGLVGSISSISGGEVTASYWDTRTSGLSGGGHGDGRSTSSLQGPTSYTGLYRGWTVESPWHFGTSREYPVLALDLDGSGGATWQEVGHQLRAGPALRGAGQPTEVALTWTAPDTSPWSPAPAIRYTVLRDAGAGLEILAEAIDATQYTDTGVVTGTTYTYQVAAVVAGGEATWSAPVRVAADDPPPPPPPRGGGGGGGRPRQPNRPPEAVGKLEDHSLAVGADPVLVDVAAGVRGSGR